MSVLDERCIELEKLIAYAVKEQEISQLGVNYQKAALDLEIAARQMLGEILKYKIGLSTH